MPALICRIVLTVPEVAEVAVPDMGDVSAEVTAFHAMKQGAAIGLVPFSIGLRRG
jgi:hypothetical protein